MDPRVTGARERKQFLRCSQSVLVLHTHCGAFEVDEGRLLFPPPFA